MKRVHPTTLLIILSCLLIPTLLLSQRPGQGIDCQPSKGGLMINEVGNLSESKFSSGASEFIELVVTGEGTVEAVNLEGFIVDDNHSLNVKNGSTQGHLLLSNCFSNVMPGTIILLYDDQSPFPGIDPVKDGTPNIDGVFQVPLSSNCLIKVSSCPSSRSDSYDCYTPGGGGSTIDWGGGGTKPLTWGDIIHLQDERDVVQIRNKGSLIHAVMWSSIKDTGGSTTQGPVYQGGGEKSLFYPDQQDSLAVMVYDGSLADRGIQFGGGDYLSATDYSITYQSWSPGLPNDSANTSFINEFIPIVCPGSGITIGCEGNSDYCYVWEDDPAINPIVRGTATVYPTEDTRYIRTTLDGDGNILKETSFLVRTKPSFIVNIEEDQLTIGDCVGEANFRFTATATEEYDSYTYLWSDGSDTSSIEVMGDQTYYLTVTASNGCAVVMTVEAQGNPAMLGAVQIQANTPSICGNTPVQLSTSFQNYSGNGNRTYLWSNGATQAVTQVNIAGEYRVTVTTSAGCVFTDHILIEPGFDLVVGADSDQACAENPVHLTADIIGDPGLGVYYEWSTGEYSQDIFVTEGGTYSVNLVTSDGCALTQSYTVADGVELSISAETDRLIPDEVVPIIASVTGGESPYTYSWSSGSTAESISVNVAGAYTLTVTDAFGCTAIDEVTILPFDETLCDGIDVSLIFHEPDCESYGSARLETLVTSGFEVSTYEWSTGGNLQELLIETGNQTYSLTVTMSNGCQTEVSIMVPSFEEMVSSTASIDLCNLVDYISLVSLAEEQATLVIDNYGQEDLITLLNGDTELQIDFTASYQGLNGPVFTTLPFVNGIDLPDPATWAGNINEIADGTAIEIGLEIRTSAQCPLTCSNLVSIEYQGAIDSVEAVFEEDPEILLTDYVCGDEYFPDSTDTDTTPLQFLNPGEIITVNGFPILIKTIDQGTGFSSDGFFSGEGVVPTPWNDRTLAVRFSGHVNQSRVIYDGYVDGIEDALTAYDFTMDTFSIGGDICIPPVDEGNYDENGIDTLTGLDQWGFVDSTGLHDVTGQIWDEYGFDREGNHVVTGDEFGPNGCNRASRDREGNTCEPEPYVAPQATAFIDSISGTLGVLLEDVLSQTVADTLLVLEIRQQECTDIRTVMDALIAGEMLDFDTKAIYGDSNQYYNPGLSLRFEQAPVALQQNIEGRDPNVIMLEDHHVSLYACDLKEVRLIEVHANLAGISIFELQPFIITQLSYLNAEEIATLRDPVALRSWLIVKINEFANSGDGTGGSNVYSPSSEDGRQNHPGKGGLFAVPEHSFNQLGTLAGNGYGSLGFASREEMLLYELNSKFKQGFQRIQGIHRAHFLEKLHRLRMEEDSSQSSNLLPLSVTKYIGGYQYTILLDGVKFMPGAGPVLNAYLIIEDPESGEKLVFEALNSPFGVGGTESSRLQLASTVAIRISNAAKLILNPERTFVDWDCEGFAGMAVSGNVEMCRKFITPLDQNTLEPLPDPERFSLDFEVYVPEWLDAVVSVDAGAFAITNHDNIKWQLDSAVIDLSDRYTPYFEPTEGYTSPHYVDGHLSPLWRGFYMSNLSATLPDDLVAGVDATNSPSVTIGVEDVLIDGKGFTGQAYVEGVDLLGLDQGSAGGWPFSIDRFNVKVIHNGFAGAGFGGDMILPIFTDTLKYDAMIYSHNRFKFTVQPDTALSMDLLLATASLHPSSKIEIGYDYNGFLAVADLTGDIKFNVPEDASVKLTLPELYFKNFKVSNRNPYFEKGIWEIRNLGVAMDFGGFSMDLSQISPYRGASVNEFGLGFNLSIALAEEQGLSAGGRFGILGELEEINERQKWKFKRIDLQGLFIDANIKDVVHVKGALQWFNDHPDYGKGFQGNLEAKFTKKPLNFTAQVAGQFGKIDTTKYFFVDAMVDLAAGIKVGPLNINGFGGGVSYHMDNEFNVAADFENGSQWTDLPELGLGVSGAKYNVDATLGLGLKATVMLATEKKEIFNGWAGLEFLFNDRQHGGGLNRISVKGQGRFMADIIPEPPEFVTDLVENFDVLLDSLPIIDAPAFGALINPVPITAWMDLSYNFNDRVFDGKLEAFMNMAGFIRGAGENNALVQAALHVDADQWYLNVGTPTHPAGVLVDIPLFSAGATAYFNVGTSIPDFPGLPANVASMAGLINTNESLRKSGGGVMFGADLWVKAGLRAGPIQAFLEANIGFDLMLRDYGDAICAGSGEQIGLNGWYAAGQSWVYLNGGVKLFGVPIFEAGFAGVMQARLPNPFWARATMAARVKLLFIEKKIKFDIEIGEQCTLLDADGNPTVDNPIINFIEPLDQGRHVPTDARPEVFFNYPINRIFKGPDGSNYKAVVSDVSLTSLGNGFQVGFDQVWQNQQTSLQLVPRSFLPGEDSLRLDITVTVYKGNTPERTETETVTFHTAGGYTVIPGTNVAYSYPTNGMVDFYREEYGAQQGYIQLKSGQSGLLAELPTGTTNQVLLQESGGAKQLIPFAYNVSNRKITFDLPAEQLVPGAVYDLSLIQKDEAGTETEVLAPIYFRVSEHKRFLDKLAEVRNSPTAVALSTTGVTSISKKLNVGAVLGDVSRLGKGLDQPLIRFSADLSSPYMYNLNRLVNNRFPITANLTGCSTFTFANATQFEHLWEAAGVTGTRELLIRQEDFLNASYEVPGRYQTLRFDAHSETAARYDVVRTQIATCINLIRSSNPEMDTTEIDELIEEVIPYEARRFYDTATFPQVPDGIYTVFVSYVLPGNAITTTPATSIDILFPPPSGAGGPGSSFREGEDNSNGTSTGSND
jgi:hypothetical protein